MEEIVVKYRSAVVFLSGVVAALAVGWFLFPFALYRTEPQPLSFNHGLHTGDQNGVACEMCHEFAPDGRFKGIPTIAKCAECHATAIGPTEAEKRLVEEYVTPGREIPWKVYSRQPDNAFFSHATHATLGKLECPVCHGPRGSDTSLTAYQVNRISGYSRDVWGPNISGIATEPWQGMKMDRCIRCHAERDRVDGCVACHK
jgi:menaquinone reductase, multiheme cytochrome c subunit